MSLATTWPISTQFLRTFKNPFILLLTGLAVVLSLTGDYPATAIIGVMVTISVLLRFVQEYRRHSAAERLCGDGHLPQRVCRPDTASETPVGQAPAVYR